MHISYQFRLKTAYFAFKNVPNKITSFEIGPKRRFFLLKLAIFLDETRSDCLNWKFCPYKIHLAHFFMSGSKVRLLSGFIKTFPATNFVVKNWQKWSFLINRGSNTVIPISAVASIFPRFNIFTPKYFKFKQHLEKSGSSENTLLIICFGTVQPLQLSRLTIARKNAGGTHPKMNKWREWFKTRPISIKLTHFLSQKRCFFCSKWPFLF